MTVDWDVGANALNIHIRVPYDKQLRSQLAVQLGTRSVKVHMSHRSGKIASFPPKNEPRHALYGTKICVTLSRSRRNTSYRTFVTKSYIFRQKDRTRNKGVQTDVVARGNFSPLFACGFLWERIHLKSLSHILNKVCTLLPVWQLFFVLVPAFSAGGFEKLRPGKYPSNPRHLTQYETNRQTAEPVRFLRGESPLAFSLDN